MYIEAVPNRNSPPAILLRESYRQGGKVRKRTLCNLSDWSPAHVEGLRGVLKGGTVIPAEQDAFTVTRSLPHGHVAAALGTARKIGLDRLLGPDGNRCRDLVLALLIGRILDPVSKLAAARTLSPATASSSLGEALGLGAVDDDELYAALDWLLERQPAIETALARRHLQNGTLVLYDVSSSYLEGRCCPLAQRGYSRDGKKGSCRSSTACSAPPTAVRSPSRCSTATPRSDDAGAADRQAQAALRPRPCGAGRRPRHDHRGAHHRGHQIRRPGLDHRAARTGDQGPAEQRPDAAHAVRPARHGIHHLARFSRRAAGGLPQSRSRRRARPQARRAADATETDLAAIKARVERKRNPLRGTAEIALAVGEVFNTHKMRKHFDLTITDDAFSFARKTAEIAAEAATDGLYVVRTSLPEATLGDADTVRSYKSLALVERAFRCIKTVDLNVRPVYHWLEGSGAGARVSVHAGLLPRMAHAPAPGADAVRRHRQGRGRGPAPQRGGAGAALQGRGHKQTTGLTPDGLPVHSFRTLLADLATLARNTIITAINPNYPLTVVTRPTPVQQKAFDLLGLAV
jgi:hypothetical protein